MNLTLRDARLDDIIQGMLNADDVEIATVLREAEEELQNLAVSTLITVLVMTKGISHPFLAECHRILFDDVKAELARRRWHDADKLLAGLR